MKNSNDEVKKFQEILDRVHPKIKEFLDKSPGEVLDQMSNIDSKDAFVIGYIIGNLMSLRQIQNK